MSDNTQEIHAFMRALPDAGKAKALIDMVNCLDVADSHLRVAEQRQGVFLSRIMDWFTGAGQRRDTAIAQHQQTTLRNVVGVTNELAAQLAHGHHALALVNDRLTTLQHALAQVVHLVADERAALQEFRTQVQTHLSRVDAELSRLDMHTAAQDQMQLVFSRWEAGMLSALPPASRAYAVLQDLYWGVFGEYQRQHAGGRAAVLLDTAKNKTTAQLRRDTGLDTDTQVALKDWLATPARISAQDRTFVQGLAWLGESTHLNDRYPAAYLCSQWPLLAEKPALPPTVPRLPSAQRMAHLVADSVFAQGSRRKPSHA